MKEGSSILGRAIRDLSNTWMNLLESAFKIIWDDLAPVGQSSEEIDLGYDTQKPLSLLERIIQASSNEGDVVLDPFCGCGTAVAAAQKLNRQWHGH